MRAVRRERPRVFGRYISFSYVTMERKVGTELSRRSLFLKAVTIREGERDKGRLSQSGGTI